MAELIITRTVAELRSEMAELIRDRDATSVGLIPTMGALHGGHAALMQAARAAHEVVVASLFINPLQFESPLDLERYPRDLAGDCQTMQEAGVDIVFAPEVEEMYPGYPDAPIIRVSSGRMGTTLEGASRPSHFDGVATVVAKLFNIFDPPGPARLHAYFGEKDAQQVMIVKRMVEDMNFPVTIEPVPTQRTPAGLAMSSRNLLLSSEQEEAALALSKALFALREHARAGRDWNLEGLRRQVHSTPDVTLDYLEVVDPATLEATTELPALALIAAYVGSVRLIDNLHIDPGAPTSGTSQRTRPLR